LKSFLLASLAIFMNTSQMKLLKKAVPIWMALMTSLLVTHYKNRPGNQFKISYEYVTRIVFPFQARQLSKQQFNAVQALP
jgi:hypothetical protein